MKLKKLTVTNFRPFHGTQEISFSHSTRRNVTVVHAENGLGKTALLNAILWCLYGPAGLTPDLEKPERIINEVAEREGTGREGSTHARTVLCFDHEGAEYMITRTLSLSQQRADPSKTELRVETFQAGQVQAVRGNSSEVQSCINAIIPRGVSPYLFFNGERMNYLGSSGNRGDIRNAIHQMLGLNLIQRTIEDLEHSSVEGRFRRELREEADEDMQRLLDQLEGLRKERETDKHSTELSDKEVAALEKEIKVISEKLEANRGVQELQKERRLLEEEMKNLGLSLQEAEHTLRRLISEEALFLFTADLVRDGRAITSKMRTEGRIPARVLKDFIRDLINAEECICKRSLKLDSPEYKAVMAQLEASPDASFIEAVSSLDNALGAMDGRAVEAKRHLKDSHHRFEEFHETLRQKDARVRQISDQIGDKDDEEVRHLERKREDCRLKIRQHDSEKGRAQGRIELADKGIQELIQKIEQCRQKAGKAELARKRLAMTESVAELLKKMLEIETQRFRRVLDEEIKRNFSRINFKAEWNAHLTSDFRLEIRKKVGDEIIEAAKSTGENQIAAFAFIGSLVSLAKRLDEEAPILKGVQGGEYPLVMDSPFGALGEGYRESVARMLPELAPQVVVFVSPTQWKGEVELNLAPRTDKRYLLQYHGQKPPHNLAEVVDLGGPILRQIVQGKHEKTKIVEVS